MFWEKSRDSASARASVKEDWHTPLPPEKRSLFDKIVREWEDAYAIFSVALDDAFSLRSEGKLIRARQCTDIAACSIPRLAEPIETCCRAMGRIGRHAAMIPAVLSLNPTFFRGESARQSAYWNQLMHHVLFSGRSRLLHKLRVLEIMIADLSAEFCRICDDLSAGSKPSDSWLRLDEIHYDVNTCLRETVVLLKSFLLTLPTSALAAFQSELIACAPAPRENPRLSAAPAIPARRAGHFRRE